VILFLDFDGVLHSSRASEPLFVAVPRLARWLDGWAGVDVVISSSWREIHPQHELVEMLGPVIGGRVVGCTPMLARARMLAWDRSIGTGEAPAHLRQREVLAWLASSWQPRRPWVALDDQAFLFKPGCGQLVLCKPHEGVTAATLVKLDRHARQAGLAPRRSAGTS